MLCNNHLIVAPDTIIGHDVMGMIEIIFILAILFVSLIVFLSIFIPITVRRKRKSKEQIIQESPIIKYGSMSMIKDIKELDMHIDFSQGIIKGLIEEDFLRGQCLISKIGEGWREHWKTKCYNQFLGKFCMKSNSITRVIGLRLGDFPGAQYTAIFQVQEINDDGSTSGSMIIKDNNKEIVIINRLFGQGGKFGSFENLISDAMDRLGTQFGNFVVQHA